MKKKLVEKLKGEPSKIRKEMRERTFSYLVAAFGLVAGLAWNEAVRSLIDYLLPSSANTVLAKFIYAILITIIVVTFTVYLEKLFKKGEKGD